MEDFTSIPIIDIQAILNEPYGSENFISSSKLIDDACRNVGK